jgi:hypothetical protein
MISHDEEKTASKSKKDARRVSFHQEITEHIIPARENKDEDLVELGFDEDNLGEMKQQYVDFLKVLFIFPTRTLIHYC